MPAAGSRVDRLTQSWVRTTGRKITFSDHPWLLGPVGGPVQIADDWLPAEAERLGGALVEGGGLLDRMSDLAGDGFDPRHLASEIVNFYEETSLYRMDVRPRWNRLALPFAWLVTSIFSRRLDQLNLPLRAHEVEDGIDSRVNLVQGEAGVRIGAVWLRTLRATGRTIYSGWYDTITMPGASRQSLRVVFPLPNGSVTVILRPDVREDGALVLKSPVGTFGTDGAYIVVAQPDRATGWVRRIPLGEEFVVFVDDTGALRTDHVLSLWKVPVLTLRYRIMSI